MANKKALLIGINQYKIPGANLRGCVNDVKNMQAVLTQFYGFAAGDMTVLTDYDATQKAMQAGIVKLLRGAKKGDVRLLHYSGHGSNVPDKNGDEADHRDEILCPTDLNWYDPLLDDWLRTTFDTLADGVNFTVVMDCCHSGSNTRALYQPDAASIPRFLPCPLDLMAAESGRALSGTTRSTLRLSTLASRKQSDIVNVDIPEVLIAGCRDTQTSADAYLNGTYNGALTYNLVETIKATRGRISYRDLHGGTTEKLKTGKFDQVPQLEGRKTHFDAPFLAPLG